MSEVPLYRRLPFLRSPCNRGLSAALLPTRPPCTVYATPPRLCLSKAKACSGRRFPLHTGLPRSSRAAAPPQDHRRALDRPDVGSLEGAASCERGTPPNGGCPSINDGCLWGGLRPKAPPSPEGSCGVQGCIAHNDPQDPRVGPHLFLEGPVASYAPS